MVTVTALFSVPRVLHEIGNLPDENSDGNREHTEELVDGFIKRYRERGDLQDIDRDGRIVLRTMEKLVSDRLGDLIALAGEANYLSDVPDLPLTMIGAVNAWSEETRLQEMTCSRLLRG